MTITPLYASADRIAGAVGVLRVPEEQAPGTAATGRSSLLYDVQHALQEERSIQQRAKR